MNSKSLSMPKFPQIPSAFTSTSSSSSSFLPMSKPVTLNWSPKSCMFESLSPMWQLTVWWWSKRIRLSLSALMWKAPQCTRLRLWCRRPSWSPCSSLSFSSSFPCWDCPSLRFSSWMAWCDHFEVPWFSSGTLFLVVFTFLIFPQIRSTWLFQRRPLPHLLPWVLQHHLNHHQRIKHHNFKFLWFSW